MTDSLVLNNLASGHFFNYSKCLTAYLPYFASCYNLPLLILWWWKNGAYNNRWSLNHEFPEQAVQTEKDGIQTTRPKIGEVFNIFEDLPQEKWWGNVK